MMWWSFAAAMPAFVRAPRSSCRARSVPAAAFQPRDSGARFHAPVAPVLTDLLRESGHAMPSNIYTARFFKQYPGPNLRFLKISATRLLQDLNCYDGKLFPYAELSRRTRRAVRTRGNRSTTETRMSISTPAHPSGGSRTSERSSASTAPPPTVRARIRLNSRSRLCSSIQRVYRRKREGGITGQVDRFDWTYKRIG